MLSQQERNSTQNKEVGCKKQWLAKKLMRMLTKLNNTDCKMLAMMINKVGGLLL